MTTIYSVPDISCDHCVAAITKHVAPLEGVVALAVDVDAKTVSVDGGVDADIRAAIDDAGFDVA